MFPPELERVAFRTDNGEFGWTREQILQVVDVLRSQGMGILGGERWWLRDEPTSCYGLIPQRHGSPGVYTWESDRLPAESWSDFVARGASEALAYVERWSAELDLPPGLEGRILYNLTWISESEYERLPLRVL
jgi:hypothetical protein